MALLKILNANKLKTASLAVAAVMLATVTVPTGVVLAEEFTPATDNNKSVTAIEVAEALRDTSGVLESSDQVKATTDADSAIKAVTAGSTVDVPKDPSEGVTLGSADGSKPAIDISLPNAGNAGDAKQVAPGTVAYPAANGSANAVQATEDGGVRMLTIIDNSSAPTAYDYKITVPNGGTIELTEDNGAVVKSYAGTVLAAVAPAWATDANGNSVGTYSTTDGTRLTQHVAHNVSGIAYPVTADPQIGFGWFVYIRLSPADQRFLMQASPSVFAGLACGLAFKHPGAVAACATSGGLVKDWLGVYYNPSRWVEVKFTYGGWFAGIKRL